MPKEADYGKRKLFSSIGWGFVAPLSGWVVQTYGVKASIYIYFFIVVATSVPTLLLPIDQLGKRGSEGGNSQVSPGAADAARGSAGAQSRRCGIREPLLSAQSLSDERAHGSKAAEMAIELSDSMEEAEAGASVLVRPVQASRHAWSVHSLHLGG